MFSESTFMYCTQVWAVGDASVWACTNSSSPLTQKKSVKNISVALTHVHPKVLSYNDSNVSHISNISHISESSHVLNMSKHLNKTQNTSIQVFDTNALPIYQNTTPVQKCYHFCTEFFNGTFSNHSNLTRNAINNTNMSSMMAPNQSSEYVYFPGPSSSPSSKMFPSPRPMYKNFPSPRPMYKNFLSPSPSSRLRSGPSSSNQGETRSYVPTQVSPSIPFKMSNYSHNISLGTGNGNRSHDVYDNVCNCVTAADVAPLHALWILFALITMTICLRRLWEYRKNNKVSSDTSTQTFQAVNPSYERYVEQSEQSGQNDTL